MTQPPKTATVPHSPLARVELRRGTVAFTAWRSSPSLALVRTSLLLRGEAGEEEGAVQGRAEQGEPVLGLELRPAALHMSQGVSSLQERRSTARMNWLVLVGVWGPGGAGGGGRRVPPRTVLPRLPPWQGDPPLVRPTGPPSSLATQLLLGLARGPPLLVAVLWMGPP